MKKIIPFIAIVALSTMALRANADSLIASCSGAVSGSQVTWSANASGGVSPYSFLWGNGIASSSQKLSYLPGVYAMNIQATDASSTVATSTCSASVLAPIINSFFVTPNPVTNGQNSTLAWSTTNAPYLSLDHGIGSVTGNSITVSPAVTTTYTLFAGNGLSTTTAGATLVVKPAPHATTTVPVVKPSTLIISDNGNVIAKGMTVKSVGSGSFTASIWGITYTVNSGTTVVVGDFADVLGKISSSSPLTINARLVQDYPAVKVIKNGRVEQEKKEFHGNSEDKNIQGKNKSLENQMSVLNKKLLDFKLKMPNIFKGFDR